MDERTLSILRQVALKAAVEVTKHKEILSYKDDVCEIAEHYYAWLQKGFNGENRAVQEAKPVSMPEQRSAVKLNLNALQKVKENGSQ